jgi:hypothetical protein
MCRKGVRRLDAAFQGEARLAFQRYNPAHLSGPRAEFAVSRNYCGASSRPVESGAEPPHSLRAFLQTELPVA